MQEKIILELVKQAANISKNAYVPYSNFPVGCVVALDDGRVVEGVNIENASYSVTLCAERSAMAYIVTHGLQERIKAIVVITKSASLGSPCGTCRQFLAEFIKKDTPIILANHSLQWVVTSINELLPRAFSKNNLNEI